MKDFAAVDVTWIMSLREKDYDVTYKILIIGESAVGKTSLIKCYSKPNESFRAALLPTIGELVLSSSISVCNKYMS